MAGWRLELGASTSSSPPETQVFDPLACSAHHPPVLFVPRLPGAVAPLAFQPPQRLPREPPSCAFVITIGWDLLASAFLDVSAPVVRFLAWWSLALGQQYTSLGSQPLLCGSIPGLVPKQLRFCRNYIEIMPSVAEGVKLGIQECQHQFRGRRWNCTTIDDSLAIFGPVLDKATRESAFVHAIASAGVAFAVTRSCAEGTSTICGCDSHHKGPPGEGWKWGGCSEDADFGVLVSREFADARENRPDARSAMNKHNNEAGRTTILDHMHLKCKCHGLSGSCEVKTCWWAQPDFRAIGDFLKDKYDSASEMVVEKHRESRGWVETLRAKYALFKPPTERDLVYYENSPNFCEPNPETGSFGTRDRTCNVTSHGIDGCDLLCCGRGHNTRTEKRKEKCHCIFHWCCYVSCQECIRIYDVHTCK
ncbi:proto-oncogene Wnt-3 [Ursus arctos]|uniref:proto-oncogene Wnt-3 n=1 Tax=Ursus arctos TaxID=9644 RepID=UPI002548BD40|nr:proto-oncogene Wnt-3 [Ursus arctos]